MVFTSFFFPSYLMTQPCQWGYQHELLISPHEMRDNYFQLKLSKTQPIVCPDHYRCVCGLIPPLAPLTFSRNFGVMVDDQLTFKVHIASFVQSCQFSFYNIRRIRPYLTKHVVRLFKPYHMFSTVVYSGHFTTATPC